MSKIDFVTALGRLLRDPELREAFACDPAAVVAQFDVSAGDRNALERLPPDELKLQAGVLVRKRFREVIQLAPKTCRAMGADCWKSFEEYARNGWPPTPTADAVLFCEWLRERGNAVSTREYNRLRFAARGARWAIHLVSESRGSFLPTGQLLLRRAGRTLEYTLRFGW